jgi:hypothetical protein
MKKIHITIDADITLDEDAEEVFNKICKESPGEELDWLGDQLRDERGISVDSYDLEYR